jgi:galactose mutarotase-like enzyme
MPKLAVPLTGLVLCAGLLPGAEIAHGQLALAAGGQVETWRLHNPRLSATFAPALGGKLISLRLADGSEVMSRSERPYTARSPGAPYGETEFDGMDECFPAVSAGPYPAAPWSERAVPDHGELCQQAWTVVDTSDGLLLRATGLDFPYTFTRHARLEGSALVLDYRVENQGEQPFWCSYANHPLFAAATGCGLELPATSPVRVAFARAGALGERDRSTTWGALLRSDGRRFADTQFASDSGEYYKYYVGPLDLGRAVFRHHSGHRISLDWDATILPYLAVWVSQGAVGGLHHVGAEVAMSRHDALADAHAAGEAQAIPPGGQLAWRIRMTVSSRAAPAPDQETGLSSSTPGGKLPDGMEAGP